MDAAAQIDYDETPEVDFEDGLGWRFRWLGTPESAEADLQLLVLRPSFIAVPSFEFALRERVARLELFNHPSFAKLHGVERRGGDPPRLAVLGTSPLGTRLSAVLASAEMNGTSLDTDAALCVLRQVVSAIAVLHESAREVAHGAISPERLLITPYARVVVLEHGLGAALQQLRYSREQYWHDLRVALPPGPITSVFDQRVDVMQLGVLALTLLLGRAPREGEYPSGLPEIVGSVRARNARGAFEPLPSGLRAWLSRALQLDPLWSFPSATAARDELEALLGDADDLGSSASLEAFLDRCCVDDAKADWDRRVLLDDDSRSPSGLVEPVKAADALVDAGPATEQVVDAGPPTEQPADAEPTATIEPLAVETPAAVDVEESQPEADAASTSTLREVARAEPVAEVESVESSRVERASDPQGSTPQPELNLSALDLALSSPPAVGSASTPRRRGLRREWLVGGAVALAVIGSSAGVYVGRVTTEPSPPLAPGSLTLTTSPTGADAYVDGAFRGLTPLLVGLSPGRHRVEVRRANETKEMVLLAQAGDRLSWPVEFEAADTNQAQENPPVPVPTGWVTVDAEIELHVFEAGVHLGSHASVLELPAGRHTLTFVNVPLGVRESREVTIEVGQTSSIKFPTPSGTLSIDASPRAEVWIDGQKRGSTPVRGLAVGVGTHDVLLKGTDAAESRHSVIVSAKEPTRLNVALGSSR